MMVIHNMFIIFKPFSFVPCMEASEFCCRFISLIQVIFLIYLYVKINEEEERATMTNNHMMDIYIIHMMNEMNTAFWPRSWCDQPRSRGWFSHFKVVFNKVLSFSVWSKNCVPAFLLIWRRLNRIELMFKVPQSITPYGNKRKLFKFERRQRRSGVFWRLRCSVSNYNNS